MGERKGTNKYYPPDFDPRKHFNLDKYHGTHALRERAKKLNQGILVIRFEMPYNIWCGGCGIHIAMGVRYNAEKSRDGSYYTTPIWKFRMKCHLCDNYFVIKTDPANHDYVIVSGARRKEQRWDPKENEQIVTEDKNDIKKMATDAMFKLEHAAEDKAKIKTTIPGIAEISEIQQQKKDDYLLNSLARKKFREERKILKTEAGKDKDLLAKSSLDIELVKEHGDDIKMAKLMKYKAVESFDEKQLLKREEIQNRSLFQIENTDPPPLNSPPSQKKMDETKKKLQLAVSKSKAADHSTFSNSSSGGAKSHTLKAKSATDLGIVTKREKARTNKDIRNCDETMESSCSSYKQLSSDKQSTETVAQPSGSGDSGSGSHQAGLLSLVTDYGSSSCTDSD